MNQALHAQPLRINSGIVAALVVWALLYFNLAVLADLLFGALPLARSSALGEAVWFFLFEVPKVLLLLTLVVFVMGVVRSYFSPERTRAILAQRGGAWNNVLAASLGIVTPFCSCSAVPLFIGFLTAGVPLGVTLSFLISAPMVNEIALALLFGLFGWKIALLYLALGLAVAIGAGLVIGRLGVERWVEGWVQELPRCDPGTSSSPESIAWRERVFAGRDAVRDIVGKVWPYVMVGIGAGAWIRLRAGQLHGRLHGARHVVDGAGGGADRHSDVFQCRRDHSGGRSPAGQGSRARNRARVHDVGHRIVLAGDDHSAQGAAPAADRHLHRCCGRGHPDGGLRVQCGFVEVDDEDRSVGQRLQQV